MTMTRSQTDPLYSTLGKDPDMGVLVEIFVEEMPDRVADLLDWLDKSDWEGLRRAAHQLKGAAGSYGFTPITPSAARVEDSIRQSRPEKEIHRAVQELADLCNRARAGAPT